MKHRLDTMDIKRATRAKITSLAWHLRDVRFPKEASKGRNTRNGVANTEEKCSFPQETGMCFLFLLAFSISVTLKTRCTHTQKAGQCWAAARALGRSQHPSDGWTMPL